MIQYSNIQEGCWELGTLLVYSNASGRTMCEEYDDGELYVYGERTCIIATFDSDDSDANWFLKWSARL